MEIQLTLTIDGKEVYRKFRLNDTAHNDWNPIINDMADSLV